jgi:hypothetical protein
LLQDYSKIQSSLAGQGKKRKTPESLFELAELARKLQQRLKTNLPSLPQGVLDTASKISAYLQRLVNFKSSSSHSEILVTVSSLFISYERYTSRNNVVIVRKKNRLDLLESNHKIPTVELQVAAPVAKNYKTTKLNYLG